VATRTTDKANLCGYIIPKFYPDAFLIAEVGVRPSDDAALPILVTAVMAEAARRGLAPRFRVYFPKDEPWLPRLFGSTLHSGNYGVHAVYALDVPITHRELEVMFTAPGARSWILDQF
jgi:hypothetical protein